MSGPPTASRVEPRAGGPSPPDAGEGLLFLREEQLRLTQALLFRFWRDFTGAADPVLEERGLGRAHHRALHMVACHPGITVRALLAGLGITKQSLARVLGPLVADGYVEQARDGGDRRQKHLHLTERGAALERMLFERQREKLVQAFSRSGVHAVDGFREVLRGLAADAPDAAERAPR